MVGIRPESSMAERVTRSLTFREVDYIQSLKVDQNEAGPNQFSGTLGQGSGGSGGGGNYFLRSGDYFEGQVGNAQGHVTISDSMINLSEQTGVSQPFIVLEPEGGAPDELHTIIAGSEVVPNREVWIYTVNEPITLKHKTAIDGNIITPSAEDYIVQPNTVLKLIFTIELSAWVIASSSSGISRTSTAGPELAINDLTDVSAANPLDDQVLVWKTADSRWENRTISVMSGGEYGDTNVLEWITAQFGGSLTAWNVIRVISSGIWTTINAIGGPAWTLFQNVIGTINTFFVDHIQTIRDIGNGIWRTLGSIADDIQAWITEQLGAAWPIIKRIADGIWTTIDTIGTTAWNLFEGVIGAVNIFFGGLGGAAAKIGEYLTNLGTTAWMAFTNFTDAVTGVGNAIWSTATDIVSAIGGAFRDVLIRFGGLVSGIPLIGSPLSEIINRLADSLPIANTSTMNLDVRTWDITNTDRIFFNSNDGFDPNSLFPHITGGARDLTCVVPDNRTFYWVDNNATHGRLMRLSYAEGLVIDEVLEAEAIRAANLSSSRVVATGTTRYLNTTSVSVGSLNNALTNYPTTGSSIQSRLNSLEGGGSGGGGLTASNFLSTTNNTTTPHDADSVLIYDQSSGHFDRIQWSVLLLRAGGGFNPAIVTNDLLPSGSNQYDLGSSSKRWEDLWVDDIVTSTIEINGALNHDGTTVGFYGSTPRVKQGISFLTNSERNLNDIAARVNNIITILRNLGLVGV